jgi:hypothetical protein
MVRMITCNAWLSLQFQIILHVMNPIEFVVDTINWACSVFWKYPFYSIVTMILVGKAIEGLAGLYAWIEDWIHARSYFAAPIIPPPPSRKPTPDEITRRKITALIQEHFSLYAGKFAVPPDPPDNAGPIPGLSSTIQVTNVKLVDALALGRTLVTHCPETGEGEISISRWRASLSDVRGLSCGGVCVRPWPSRSGPRTLAGFVDYSTSIYVDERMLILRVSTSLDERNICD